MVIAHRIDGGFGDWRFLEIDRDFSLNYNTKQPLELGALCVRDAQARELMLRARAGACTSTCC